MPARAMSAMDPRQWRSARPGVDIVGWIEGIPFEETRGYVQRVLENSVVYDRAQPDAAAPQPVHCLTISASRGPG